MAGKAAVVEELGDGGMDVEEKGELGGDRGGGRGVDSDMASLYIVYFQIESSRLLKLVVKLVLKLLLAN